MEESSLTVPLMMSAAEEKHLREGVEYPQEDSTTKRTQNEDSQGVPFAPDEASSSINNSNNNSIRSSRNAVFRLRSDTTLDDSHPETPPTPWYKNPTQLSAMLSNFSTSYNVVNISLVLPILQALDDDPESDDAIATVASSLLAGMMVGQIAGGALGDVLGCERALQCVMTLQVCASFGSACTTNLWTLSMWRLALGVGAGGVYPLAAVLSANDDSDGHLDGPKSSLHRIVLTFSTQGLGFVTVPLVALPLLYTIHNLEIVWRLLLALGSGPGILMMLLHWRWYSQRGERRELVLDNETLEGNQESIIVTASDDENESILDSMADGFDLENGTSGENSRSTWWSSLRNEQNLVRKFLGTAATWFLFDVLFYGNTLFQPIVLEAAFGPRDELMSTERTSRHMLLRTAMDSLAVSTMALPGYAVAGILLGHSSRWCYCGRKQTLRFVMLQGFAFMAILYLTIGATWSSLRRFPVVLVALYGLTFFFANYGPNTTTFVLPSLVYSPECRSTFNGLSAAAGKLGALAGASLFEPVADKLGDPTVMMVCGCVAMVALFLTKEYVPESLGHGYESQQESSLESTDSRDVESPFV